MLESQLSVPLDGRGYVEQGERADEVLWLCQEPDVGEDWSMVAAPVALVAAVLLDCHGAVRVVLDHDPVRVRHALVILVDEGVLILLSLVRRHKLDLALLVPREHTEVTLGYEKLIKLWEELWRSEHFRRMLLVGSVEAEV